MTTLLSLKNSVFLTLVTYAGLYEQNFSQFFTFFTRFPKEFLARSVEDDKMLMEEKHERKLKTGFYDIKNSNINTMKCKMR